MSLRQRDDDEDLSDGSVTTSSQSSKRRRLNSESPDHGSDADILPDNFRRSPRAIRVNQHGEEKHQPGSLVRITVKNFVTYTKATFDCGPSLNMIIGPNGTGKSTLVCAICLGLGYKPNVLGRAKEIGEFVKHGSREAEIEVELAGKNPKRPNPVLHHTIKRDGNKSSWRINGQQATHKDVMKLVRSFNIQIDNLCQFLPQDRVVEFAQMTPVGLLESTQKAAAQEHMTTWHTQLKQYGAEKINMQATHVNKAKELEALEKRQAAQQVEVDRLRERRGLLTRLQALEMARPGLSYRIEKEKWEDMKRTKHQYKVELDTLKQQVAPALREVEEKEAHVGQLKEAVDEAENIATRFGQEAEKRKTAVQRKKEEITNCEQEHSSEVQAHNKRKPELARLEAQIRTLENQRDEAPMEFDGPAFNARIREKDQQVRELRQQAEGIKEQENAIKEQAGEKHKAFTRAKQELQELQSASGQQAAKLKKASADTWAALEWLREHRDEFEDKIYGPPLLECAVKDPRYAAAVESLLQRGDMLCFTCTNRNDWNKFRAICQNQLRLKDIYSRRSAHPLSHWTSPMSKEQLAEYGLEDFALDFLQGPEPVLSMLCDAVKLNRTGLSRSDCSDAQFVRLKDSPIQSWVAGQNSYKVTRRREYGPGAVSTMVSQLRPAQFWTNASGDTDAMRDAHRKLKDIQQDMAELDEQRKPFEGELKELKARMSALGEEMDDIRRDKNEKQKAYSVWQALPAKIATLQEKKDSMLEAQRQFQERLAEIGQRQQGLILDRAKLAIDYTVALEKSMEILEEAAELEIKLIEAESELEHLHEQSQRVRNMLAQRELEIRDLEKVIKLQHEKCRRLVKEFQDMQQKLGQMENGDEIQEIMANWLNGTDGDEDGTSNGSAQRTPDDLEADIISARQRIELLHEGNPRALEQFEQRAKDIEKAKADIAAFQANLEAITSAIDELRQKWEPELDQLVGEISAAFAHNFERIGCAGQVSVRKDPDDFREWAIQIEVKFRENEELAILDSHRQSGGERAVSTIFYLMALQSMARSPFRVVDEINQGMDPRNERMVHERMVDIACSENTSQYFLVTPKLLNGLKYHPRMVVHVIYSGDEMPANEGEMDGKLDFKHFAELALKTGKVF